jgi:hypothetical protein
VSHFSWASVLTLGRVVVRGPRERVAANWDERKVPANHAFGFATNGDEMQRVETSPYAQRTRSGDLEGCETRPGWRRPCPFQPQ